VIHHCKLVHILLVVQDLRLESLLTLGQSRLEHLDLPFGLFELTLILIDELIFIPHVLLNDLFLLLQLVPLLLDQRLHLGVELDLALLQSRVLLPQQQSLLRCLILKQSHLRALLLIVLLVSLELLFESLDLLLVDLALLFNLHLLHSDLLDLHLNLLDSLFGLLDSLLGLLHLLDQLLIGSQVLRVLLHFGFVVAHDQLQTDIQFRGTLALPTQSSQQKLYLLDLRLASKGRVERSRGILLYILFRILRLLRRLILRLEYLKLTSLIDSQVSVVLIKQVVFDLFFTLMRRLVDLNLSLCIYFLRFLCFNFICYSFLLFTQLLHVLLSNSQLYVSII